LDACRPGQLANYDLKRGVLLMGARRHRGGTINSEPRAAHGCCDGHRSGHCWEWCTHRAVHGTRHYAHACSARGRLAAWRGLSWGRAVRSGHVLGLLGTLLWLWGLRGPS
jgi:hypothetical protein